MALHMNWLPSSLLRHKRTHGAPPLGLKNLGNSCYLNSVLQCLTYTPPLANFCLSLSHSSFCNSVVEPDRKRDCPFCILEKRIVRSLSIDLALDSPAKIVSCLQIFAEHFRCGRQEDAHEFLRYVIDACHKTSLRLRKLQQQRKKLSNGGGGESVDGGTVVKEIFGGALQSQVKCLSCGSESNKVDEIMDISLDILHSSSLKEAMQKFFQPEILDGSNKYKCEKCKKLVAAKKQMSILQAPNVLAVQLKRFGGIFGGKIDKAIAFEDILVLSSFMCKASQDPHPEYSLFGTIVHLGFSPESGHYYAYIKDAMGRWYCCNDSAVTVSTLQEVLSERVYILFFTRTNQRPSSSSKAVVSNGLTCRSINGSVPTKTPKTALPPKTVNKKPLNEPSLARGFPAENRVDKGSFSLQNKFNSLTNFLAKKVSSNSNGKIDVQKSQCVEKNGDFVDYNSKEKSGKNVPPLTNSNSLNENGRHNVVDIENRHILANGNGHICNGVVDHRKDNLHEANGLRCSETTQTVSENGVANGHTKISVSKRKLKDRDPCILFAEDTQSQARLEEFKLVLGGEASLYLQSCGWTDEVYKHLRSKRRECVASYTSSNNDELKKRLIDDAKSTFISKIPGSLKESLIRRIRSFSEEKQSSNS